ncbi:S8 family peptidase [Streptomyces sp. MI02-7b]|uniref:S8 family peptidase n=1 Tax=Streptomyces sp. MI02-7b TaxID=462941 RepID=UPI0029B33D2A|nr:S8 family serine peptidase [Streptomyces sp. MI02-7b]MDX3074176.1 S8 family serine peptidase [Streptomyces sp. MI02-7b]
MTLITGDKVTVTPGAAGTAPEVSVKRAPGATGSVRVSTEGTGTYVYPEEATAYIAAGRLDKELFNVTQLISQGYDDKHTSELPLILTHTKDSATLADGAAKSRTTQPDAALPGTETTLNLPAVHGEAVRTHRSKAAAFWSALTGPARHQAKPSTDRDSGTPDTAVAPPFTAGVDQVWLDGQAKATLADSTAQIGAPAVWAAGGTGAGVRVAVLDTGIDAEHPDFAKRIVASRSFIPGESTADVQGHGTHTASTVAGTGAASGGTERGVAPEADLLVGKVLNNQGYGQDSWIIAGMEWAARTEHAKVISMSLGDSTRHGQNDPVSQALNKLTAETGALFVVAAGNGGPGPYTLGAPGTADAALTVGAVDQSDVLAPFSSAGPRLLDDALKPDITAPGVGVLAARSHYLNDGSEGYYRYLDGTSMATPHVAGAAALLAQKHPEWTAQDIKNTLMSTSMRTPDYTPYQAGTGRVALPSAYDAEAFATGSVDAGLVPWSSTADRRPISRTITYTNVTGSPLKLDLSVDAGSSPAKAFALGAAHVTVPAHGTAQAELVVDPKGLSPGQYSAQVMASGRGPAGRVTMHTVAGVSVEPEKHNLTIKLKDRSGRPMSGAVLITGDNGADSSVYVPEDGTLTSRWLPGTYTVRSYEDVQGLHGPHSLGEAVLVDPEVDLTSDRTVVLDASQARQVKVATPKPTAVVQSRIDVWRSFTSTEPDPAAEDMFDAVFPPVAYDSLWALPTKGKVKKGSFAFGTRFRAEQTPLAVSYGGHHLDDALLQPGTKALPDGTSHLDAVFAGDGSRADYAGLSARGKAVVVRLGDVVSTDQEAAAAEAGAAMLVVVNRESGRLGDLWYGKPDFTTTGPVPVASVTLDEGEELIKEISKAGRKQVKLAVEVHATPEYLYDLADYHIGAVPEDPSADTDPRDLARIDLDFALAPGQAGVEKRNDYPPYQFPGESSLQWPGTVHLPFPSAPVVAGTRTDWVSGNGVRWQQFAAVNSYTTHTDTVTFTPGSKQEDRWFGPVTRPRLLSDDVLHRFPDGGFGADIDGGGDAGSAHNGASTHLTALYQGDRKLAETPFPSLNVGDVAPERLPYRLVVDTTGDPAGGPYSSTTHTEWRFTSGAVTESQAIPLVQLDYTTDLDLQGRAKRKTDIAIEPTVVGGSTAKDAVSSVLLDVSYDDGKTWHAQKLKEKKGTWQASLTAPSAAEYVSLRVTAAGQQGGGVTQTITRAFGLKP